MTISQLLRTLWARRKVTLNITGGIVLVVMAITLLLPPKYTATVSLLVDAKGADLLTGVAANQLTTDYMATQADVIGSRNVALKVVDQFKLTNNPNLQKHFRSATDGNADIRVWIADMLLGNLDVLPTHESSVLNVKFSSEDPKLAADIANGFADAYIITSLELKNDPARRQADWFDQQIQALRKNLEEVQQKLTVFQRENNLVSIDPNRLDVENARLGDLANQLVAVQGTKYDSLSRLNQLKQLKGQDAMMQLPDILGNPLLQSMKGDLVRAEGKLAETAERYDRNHPQYTSAAAEVNTLRSKLSAEIATARGSIEQNEKLAERREAELQQAVDEQKTNILELQKQRDQQAVLNREVDNAQRTYDAALQRSSQVRMESELNQSSIAVLNPAVPPLKPSKPNILLNFVLALVSGVLFGAASALLREYFDQRVRSTEDIVLETGLPVLAELPKNQPKKRGKDEPGVGLVPA